MGRVGHLEVYQRHVTIFQLVDGKVPVDVRCLDRRCGHLGTAAVPWRSEVHGRLFTDLGPLFKLVCTMCGGRKAHAEPHIFTSRIDEIKGEPEREVTIAPLVLVDGELRRSDEHRRGYAVDAITPGPGPLPKPGCEA